MSRGRPFTAEDISTLRRLVASGMTDSQIAERMGRCRGMIVSKRGEHGIRPAQSRAMSAALFRIRMRQKVRM